MSVSYQPRPPQHEGQANYGEWVRTYVYTVCKDVLMYVCMYVCTHRYTLNVLGTLLDYKPHF